MQGEHQRRVTTTNMHQTVETTMHYQTIMHRLPRNLTSVGPASGTGSDKLRMRELYNLCIAAQTGPASGAKQYKVGPADRSAAATTAKTGPADKSAALDESKDKPKLSKLSLNYSLWTRGGV